MSRELRHCESENLLGVYALDALDAEERLLVEDHLAGCPTCLAEVVGHYRAAASLTRPEAAPLDIWNKILSELAETPPPLELVPAASLAYRRPRTFKAAAAITTVAAAAIGVLGFRLVDQDRRLDQLQAEIAAGDIQGAALAAASNPAAVKIDLHSPDGPAAAQAVLLPSRRGYLLADGLPALAPDRTYQLWTLVDGQRISAGTLGVQPKISTFHTSGRVDGFAVTEEGTEGVVASKSPPVLIGWVRSA